MATSAARKKTHMPPKHRHDGTSPLPLGMDWSPPPKRWAQLLARDDEQGFSDDGDNSDGKSSIAMSSEDANITDEERTKMLSDLLIDNAQLRMRLTSVVRNSVNTSVKPEKEDSGVFPRQTVPNWLLDR